MYAFKIACNRYLRALEPNIGRQKDLTCFSNNCGSILVVRTDLQTGQETKYSSPRDTIEAGKQMHCKSAGDGEDINQMTELKGGIILVN